MTITFTHNEILRIITSWMRGHSKYKLEEWSTAMSIYDTRGEPVVALEVRFAETQEGVTSK